MTDASKTVREFAHNPKLSQPWTRISVDAACTYTQAQIAKVLNSLPALLAELDEAKTEVDRLFNEKLVADRNHQAYAKEQIELANRDREDNRKLYDAYCAANQKLAEMFTEAEVLAWCRHCWDIDDEAWHDKDVGFRAFVEQRRKST